MRAFTEGAVAGFGIAIPVGPIAVLIVDLGLHRGFVPAFAAGLGAATADFLYASIAAVVGLAAAEIVDPIALPVRAASVAVIAGIAVYRTWRLFWGPVGSRARASARGVAGTFLGFLALTLVNPLTIGYFAALILGLQASVAGTAAGKALFVAGAFCASALWQTMLAGSGAFLRHRLSDRARIVTGLVGNLVIATLALRLALAP